MLYKHRFSLPQYLNLLFCKVEMSCHLIQNNNPKKKKPQPNDKYRFAVAASGLFSGEKRAPNAEAL